MRAYSLGFRVYGLGFRVSGHNCRYLDVVVELEDAVVRRLALSAAASAIAKHSAHLLGR